MTISPRGESRPGEGRLSKKSLAGDSSMIQPIGDTSVATGRRYWARQLIDRQTPNRPQYGSTAWLMLPNDHPDKVAAAVVAAECWASTADTLEDDLRREIEQLQIGHKREEDRAYIASVEAHRQQFGGRVLSSFEERRRRQLEAAQPRPGDFKGRGEGA